MRGMKGRRLFSLVRIRMTQDPATVMLDESEFLSPFGVRALSRSYLDQPYHFEYDGVDYQVEAMSRRSPTADFSAATRTGADPCGCRAIIC